MSIRAVHVSNAHWFKNWSFSFYYIYKKTRAIFVHFRLFFLYLNPVQNAITKKNPASSSCNAPFYGKALILAPTDRVSVNKVSIISEFNMKQTM